MQTDFYQNIVLSILVFDLSYRLTLSLFKLKDKIKIIYLYMTQDEMNLNIDDKLDESMKKEFDDL